MSLRLRLGSSAHDAWVEGSTTDGEDGSDTNWTERLREMGDFERALLNDLIHHASGTFPTGMDERVREGVQRLERAGFIVGPNDDRGVPAGLLEADDAPGYRYDQVWGFWRFLPETARRDWSDALGCATDPPRVASLMERLDEANDEGRAETFRRRQFEDCRWRPLTAFPESPRSIDELYRWAGSAEGPLAAGLRAGLWFPTWEESGELTGFLLSTRWDESPPSGESPGRPDADVEWERDPFDLFEQVKILLLMADAFPFRKTQRGYPHLFDLKEAADLTDWSVDHVHRLVQLAMEEGLIRSGEDRFHLTQRAMEWAPSVPFDALFRSRIALDRPVDPEGVPYRTPDFSTGRVLERALERLREEGETGALRDDLVRGLGRESVVWEAMMCSGQRPVRPGTQREHCAGRALSMLCWFGFLDRWGPEGDPEALRINERGRRALQTGSDAESAGAADSGELPFILQPDGSLLIPLPSSLEDFRRVNPFALLVEVDNMVQYRIDRQSLVTALNEGWDTRQFYDFVESRADGIPDPIRALFEDVAEPAEEVEIERVHHLLRFESGATAVKAMRALSNYRPVRVGENTILLRSKTTEETIRRNLSREGVRLRSTVRRDRAISPLAEDL